MVSRRDDRSGLGRFDITPAAVVREPARNPDGSVICPECGQSVPNGRGTYHIRPPDMADSDLRAQLDEPLLVHGWLCVRYEYDVVIPVNCRGTVSENASHRIRTAVTRGQQHTGPTFHPPEFRQEPRAEYRARIQQRGNGRFLRQSVT